VAPNPVINSDFTKTPGQGPFAPNTFSIPAFGVRLAFGEMADALLLSSQRVEPARLKLQDTNLSIHKLDGALRHILQKTNN